jgi:hypothetical protein
MPPKSEALLALEALLENIYWQGQMDLDDYKDTIINDLFSEDNLIHVLAYAEEISQTYMDTDAKLLMDILEQKPIVWNKAKVYQVNRLGVEKLAKYHREPTRAWWSVTKEGLAFIKAEKKKEKDSK